MSGGDGGTLRRRTAGERLLVDRRRRGETQAEAAARYGVGRTTYGGWERGDLGAPSVAVGRLTVFECCLLRRRRAGLTQAEVARAIGYCRWYVNRMEHGTAPYQPLVDYWEAHSA